MTYKETKNLDELIDHLYEKKNVRFNVTSKEEAKVILLTNNYVNVVTPFKHKFCLSFGTGKDKKFKNSEDKHVYPNEIEFSEIVNFYIEERKNYSAVRDNIDVYESMFKSIATHVLLVSRKNQGKEILNIDDLKYFISECNLRLHNSTHLNALFTEKNIDHWKSNVTSSIGNPSDIFVYFDHLTLGNWAMFLSGLDKIDKDAVFNELKKHNLHLGTTEMDDFCIRFKIMREVRNCIAHRNSIEILFRYRNVSQNKLRFGKEKIKYERFYEELKIKNKYVDIYS